MKDNKYIRDDTTNAILETNLSLLEQHRQRRKILKGKDQRINQLEQRIETLEIRIASLEKLVIKEN